MAKNSSIEKAMTIVPRVTGMVSMISSLYIISDIVSVSGGKPKETKDLLLISMNVADLLWTFTVWFLGSWPSPKGMGIYGAVGNTASCEAQGYLGFVFAGTATAYNALMAIVFLLIVRYQWKETRLTRMRPYLIYVPIIFYAVSYMPVLIMDGFNSNHGTNCRLTPSPINCETDPNIECERGEEIVVYGGIFTLITMVMINICLICTMSMLYWTVLQLERRMDRYTLDERANRIQSKILGVHGLLYVLAFYLAWLPPLITVILGLSGVVPSQGLKLITATTTPLQGFYNALVYLRPGYLKYRKDHPDQSLWNIVCTRSRSLTKASTAVT